jgi:hypothetical protein
MSFYAQQIATLAPDADPAHVEAWMRLEHPTLDGLSPERFAGEVRVAVDCIQAAGDEECDALARSYGLQPRPRPDTYAIGDHVLVARDAGLEPAVAEITATSEARPHLVKVNYTGPARTGAWIARKRIVGRVGDGAPRPPDDRRAPPRPGMEARRDRRALCAVRAHLGRARRHELLPGA